MAIEPNPDPVPPQEPDPGGPLQPPIRPDYPIPDIPHPEPPQPRDEEMPGRQGPAAGD